jgi:hypothetical protein
MFLAPGLKPEFLALPDFRSVKSVVRVSRLGEADFAQDSRHFNLAFTISRYKFEIDGRKCRFSRLSHVEARRTR